MPAADLEFTRKSAGFSAQSEEVCFGPFRLIPSRRLLKRSGGAVALGGRSFDILLMLVERAGRIVSKTELIARISPDSPVGEESIRFHVGAVRKALGDGTSGARYVITVAGQGYCFVAPVLMSSGTGFLTAETSALSTHNLPVRLPRLIGRDEQVLKVCNDLAAKRFVSIVGPGGIGKTALAVVVAHSQLGSFAGAVKFLDLGPIADPLLVRSAVASTLGLAVTSADPTYTVVQYLRNKRILLIFDSCEHVIDQVASFADLIFKEAQHVHVLATSRESLLVAGEHVHRLSALASPPAKANLTAVEALSFPAAQLLSERVRAREHRFELNDAEAVAVGEICRKLDGMPLAIELAAGRVAAHGIQETLSLLNDRLTLFWEGRRTAPLRQQTLNATLDWSYNLLSATERFFLCCLSVFAGSFTLEAACSVSANVNVDEAKSRRLLGGLVAKSLVVVRMRDDTIRYRLLDVTRAYVAAKLAHSGKESTIKQKHLDYYLSIFEQAAPTSLLSSGDAGLPAELLDNTRTALKWGFSSQAHIRGATALAAAAGPFFCELSLMVECYQLTKTALASLLDEDRGTRREMELQGILGISLLFSAGHGEEARPSLERALTLAKSLDDTYSQLRHIRHLHTFLFGRGSFRPAADLAEHQYILARRTGDPIAIAVANHTLAYSQYFRGNQQAAEAHCTAALLQPTSFMNLTYIGYDRDIRTRATCVLAACRWIRGFPEQAGRMAQDALRNKEAVEHPGLWGSCLTFAAFMFSRIGDLELATTTSERLIAHAEEYSLGIFRNIGLGLRGLLAVEGGNAYDGIDCLRGALAMLHADRYQLHDSAFLGSLAQGLAQMGRSEDALSAINKSIAHAVTTKHFFNVPELLRIKGSILMSKQRPDFSGAQRLFARSLSLARGQTALAWELRTSTSLAEMHILQKQPESAVEVLSPVYSRFSEGFDTSDLRVAKVILESLRSSGHSVMPPSSALRASVSTLEV